MKIKSLLFLSALLALTGTTAQAGVSVEKCKETFGKFKRLGKVPEMLAQSYGHAVLPTIGWQLGRQ